MTIPNHFPKPLKSSSACLPKPGPCFLQKHYTVETDRCTADVGRLIDDGLYFILHAARQTGKTTTLKALTRSINAEGRYYALYCSLETVERVPDVKDGIRAIISALKKAFHFSEIPNGATFAAEADLDDLIGVVGFELSVCCKKLGKPLILFLDEADCLHADLLVTFLRQLRDGYVNREEIPLVHSIALIGMRNIRDYKDQIRGEEKTLGSASPFNIITDAFTLNNFTPEEVAGLYQQHTDESGQLFTPDAVGLVWEKTTIRPVQPANPIYNEMICRALSYSFQENMANSETPYVMPRYLRDGKIDMDYLMRDFQQFWRENSAIWQEKCDTPNKCRNIAYSIITK